MINVLTHASSRPPQREDTTLFMPDTDYDMRSYSYTEYHLDSGRVLTCQATPLLILQASEPVTVVVTQTTGTVIFDVKNLLITDIPMTSFTVAVAADTESDILMFHKALVS